MIPYHTYQLVSIYHRFGKQVPLSCATSTLLSEVCVAAGHKYTCVPGKEESWLGLPSLACALAPAVPCLNLPARDPPPLLPPPHLSLYWSAGIVFFHLIKISSRSAKATFSLSPPKPSLPLVVGGLYTLLSTGSSVIPC